ncbi:unnamed protein product [Orchesella dallaii]|uniref:Uncharacterized protein n=1 Tax=Orchesella dallaii TaxID=48710 RepID=A0ABP1R4U1_9HEXA
MQPGQSYYFFSIKHTAARFWPTNSFNRPSLFSGQTPTPPATSYSNQRGYSTPLNNENLRIRQDYRKITSSRNQLDSNPDLNPDSNHGLNPISNPDSNPVPNPDSNTDLNPDTNPDLNPDSNPYPNPDCN